MSYIIASSGGTSVYIEVKGIFPASGAATFTSTNFEFLTAEAGPIFRTQSGRRAKLILTEDILGNLQLDIIELQ